MAGASTKAVLIVTEKFDPHADHVIKALNATGVPFFRLNTNDFHQDIAVTADSRDSSILFEDRWRRSHSFPRQTRSIWYRKPVDPAPPSGVTDPAARQLILQETLELLTYLSVERRLPWYNNPHDNRFAQRKFPQIRIAQELGLRVPRTIVTNDPGRVREFGAAVDGNVLCKSMKEQGFRDEKDGYFIFSRKVAADEMDRHVDMVANCPTLFQEYIEKDHELRITIVGERTFCCRLDSQSVTGAETDWRKVDPSQVRHEIVPLDARIEAALRSMMAHYGLRYGAFDMIVTPEGDYVFLELNPNGQWLWIELMTGAPITEAITSLLTG